jgi:2-polyprenyl-3-methyl-5-hydroxy-6-metoxy-1,4-benzoquinol methylase
VRDYSRLDRLLDSLMADVYAEPPSEPHVSITSSMLARLVSEGIIGAGQQALDVGCGQGLALARMRELGMHALGTAMGEDVAICRAKKLVVCEMDQSFMDFAEGEFDFLWCRHVLEHSIFPLFTLTEYMRVLKRGGHSYIEVPAPDTALRHQANPNHYSVLGKSMWLELFRRAGLTLVWQVELGFAVRGADDLYWGFLLRKPH